MGETVECVGRYYVATSPNHVRRPLINLYSRLTLRVKSSTFIAAFAGACIFVHEITIFSRMRDKTETKSTFLYIQVILGARTGRRGKWRYLHEDVINLCRFKRSCPAALSEGFVEGLKGFGHQRERTWSAGCYYAR